MNKRGGMGKIILIFVILMVLIVAIYFSFFFYYKCNDIACFRAHQEKCAKTKFLNEVENAEWQYFIKGEQDGKCKINVKVNRVTKGGINELALEGKSMDCFLPKGSLNSPEADISICHGELKEKTQEIIIQKLHSYIVKNLGEISGELKGITTPVTSVVQNQTINNSTSNQTNVSAGNQTTNSSA